MVWLLRKDNREYLCFTRKAIGCFKCSLNSCTGNEVWVKHLIVVLGCFLIDWYLRMLGFFGRGVPNLAC